MEVTLVCVPYQVDIARWGCAGGPQAFLDAGMATQIEARGHHIRAVHWIELPKAERTRDSVTNHGRIARRTGTAVKEALIESEGFVLVLEGDCTHAVGAIGGLAQASGQPGVVWFDAHGDINTMHTTTTGFLGGLPYAVALGWDLEDWRLAAGLEPAVQPRAAALIGTSDLDAAEQEALQRHPLLHVDATPLMHAEGAKRVQALLERRTTEAKGWYMHLDLDVAGPEELPGGMTPAPFWPPRHYLLEAVAAAARAVPVRVLGVAVYNPAFDSDGRGARLGIDMAMAVFDSIRDL